MADVSISVFPQYCRSWQYTSNLLTLVRGNEKNTKLSKDLMTAGRKHKTNVVMSILIKSSFVDDADDVNE